MTETPVAPSPKYVPERVDILGFPIDRVNLDETRTLMKELLGQEDGTKLILTADSNAYINAATDKGYQRMFQEAALITPDSAGPVWALDRLGKKVPSRVSGVDLVEVLCQLSEETGASLYFLGAAPNVAETAAQNLKKRFPNMKIAGVRDGYFKPSDDQDVAQSIRATKPDVLIVAMGMPRQELFILDTANIVGAKIGIGVGGSLDVHSGMVKRAPKFIQSIRMEWFWRLILNPKKFAKVKNLPIFYWKVRRYKAR